MTFETPSLEPTRVRSGFNPTRSLQQWARRLVLNRLQGLTGGRIVARDAWGEWQAGSGEPVFEIEVVEPRFYVDVVLRGSLGAGGAYVEGRWTCRDLPELLRLFTRNVSITDSLEGGAAKLVGALSWAKHKLRANNRSRAKRNIHAHYDLGNEFFETFLDPTMTYSSAIFETESSTLEQASIAKLDRICRKLDLRPEHHVLEIGTGWGSFALHAASHYGCRVTTTTISEQQRQLAAERVRQAGLENRVQVLLEDYRDLSGRFDRLVSIEMIEAVGHEYLPVYFSKCGSLLEHDGAMLLQAITMPDHRYAQYLRSSDFIREHVFPGSSCPALFALQNAIGGTSDMKLVNLEDIGAHYARTLRCWRQQFHSQSERVLELGYPQRLIRLWDYYLSYCEAGFAERYISAVQLLLHRPGCRVSPPLLMLTGGR